MARRQLAAIMFTDFVGYSVLTQRNETLALELLERHWELLRPIFAKFDGREIKTLGDGFLIEFPSALRAVEAGLAVQVTLTDYNDTVDADHSIQVRIGIHLGDVERRGDDVFGDGVNIAARLEPLATSGGICISELVYSSVHNNLDVPFYSMGEQTLKNISQPIVVYSNHPHNKATPIKSNRYSPIVGIAIATVIVLLIIITLAWIKEEPPTVITTTTEKKPGEKIEAAVVADRKSVAVLPFTNRSDEKKDAFFVDGIHDDILTQLAKIANLKVISRTSVMGYRDTTKNMKTIGNELDVTTLLEGSVQRAQNQVRINVQLIDANTDEHLWAETYDRELTAANIFAIQSEIATAIANALQATLSPEEQERLAAVPTEDLAAYEAYLLGKQRMATRNSEALAEAVDYFQRAIDLDPNFALAYVGLSDVHQLQIGYSGLAKDEMNALAKTAINKALALDDKSGEAYASLGLLKQDKNDFDGAEVAYKKAMALNPSYATTYHWYGNLLRKLGRDEEASALMQKALALDPLSIIINANVAQNHLLFGRFNEAMELFEKIIEIDPASTQGYFGKARLYWFVYGRLDEAAPWLRKAVSLDPSSPLYNAIFGALYLNLGGDKQAECWVNQAIKLGPEGLFINIFMSYLHASRNENEQASSSARQVLKIDPTNHDALKFLRNHDLRAGSYDKARSRYEQAHPALLTENEPTIDRVNYQAAIDLAYVLQLTGEQERANLLLDRSLTIIRSGIHRLDFDGYGIADVQIYTLQGEKQRALTTLRQAIDEGWRAGWWYYLEHDPSLESIRNEPEFQAMLQEIKADMASQLVRVKAMEKEGDVCVDP